MAEPKVTTAEKKPAPAKKSTAAAKLASKPKAATAKAPAAKKPAAPKASSKAAVKKTGHEERYRMVEVAAYFIAERNGFKGSPVEYWMAAEAQISKLLNQ